MTDNKTPEGGAEVASEGLPIPKLEKPSPDSATSSVDTEAIAKKVAEILKPDFEKVAQSTKDKRIAALEKRLGLGDLAELEEMGVTIPDSAKMEYRLRLLERRPEESSDKPQPSQGSGEKGFTAQYVSEVIKENNLDANDPQVLELLRGTYRNNDHFEAVMAKAALARVNRPAGSVSAAPVIRSTGETTQAGEKELVEKYTQEMTAARGRPAELKAIKEKYRKLNIPVDSIGFNV